MWLFDVVVVVRDWHCFALSSLNNWFRARQTDGEKEREITRLSQKYIISYM